MHRSLSTSTTDAEIGARIDRIPSFTGRMRILMALLAVMFAFELIDLQTFALVAPAVQREWGLDAGQIGVLTSMLFIGGLIGAFVGGYLLDRIGRRRVVLVSVTLFSLGSLGSAFAPSAEVLGLLRLVTGIGVSAAGAAILVMVSECFPKPLRGRAMAIVIFISVLGSPILTAVASIAVPSGNWHYVFLFGSLGLVAVIPALWLLPESPRWLASHGLIDKANAAVQAMEDEYVRTKRTPLPKPAELEPAGELRKGSLLDLFRPRVIKRTLIAMVLFGSLLIINTGLNNWFPVILDQRGYPLEQAYPIFVIVSFGALVGPVLVSIVIDRIERKWLIVSCSALLGITYLLIGFVDAVPMIIVGGLAAVITATVLFTVLSTYIPELFEIDVRGIGTGLAQGFSRVTAVVNAIVIGFLLSRVNTESVFIYLVAVTIVVAIAAAFGPSIGIREAHRARVQARKEARRAKGNPDAVERVPID